MSSQNHKRLRRHLVVLLSLVSLLWAGLWFVTSADKDLLARSTVLLDLSSHPHPGNVSIRGWLTDHELLCGIGGGDVDDDFFVVDTRQGQYRALPALTAFQHENGTIPLAVSPDGRWLLCTERLHGDVMAHNHTDTWQYEIQGDRVFTLQTGPGVNFVWSADSQSCLAWDEHAQCILQWPLAVSGRCDRRPIASIAADTWLIGVHGQNAVFTTAAPDANQAPICEMVWSDPAYKRVLCTLHSSQKGSIDTAMHLSPDGQRLAWRESVSVNRPGPAWLQWVYRKLGMGSGDYNVLWTCRIDGTDRRKIGYVQAIGLADGSEGLDDFGWDFTGKGLWFTYHGRIRNVPAD